MGWPRGNGYRLYFEKKYKTYLLVWYGEYNGSGNFDAIGNAYGKGPKLCTTAASPGYISTWGGVRRVSWNDMPQVWQDAFREWFDDDNGPEVHRGLWRMGEQPEKV